MGALDGGEHGIAGRGADGQADARHMQVAGALDQLALETGRRHAAGGGIAPQVAEGMALRACCRVQAGMGVRVHFHAGRVHALGLPQFQQLGAEAVPAHPRQVGAARPGGRRRRVGGVAAEALLVLRLAGAGLVEFDQGSPRATISISGMGGLAGLDDLLDQRGGVARGERLCHRDCCRCRRCCPGGEIGAHVVRHAARGAEHRVRVDRLERGQMLGAAGVGGKIFTMSTPAPAHPVGVKAPSRHRAPAAWAMSTASVARAGETRKSAPATSASRAWLSSSTVPTPSSSVSPCCRAARQVGHAGMVQVSSSVCGRRPPRPRPHRRRRTRRCSATRAPPWRPAGRPAGAESTGSVHGGSFEWIAGAPIKAAPDATGSMASLAAAHRAAATGDRYRRIADRRGGGTAAC